MYGAGWRPLAVRSELACGPLCLRRGRATHRRHMPSAHGTNSTGRRHDNHGHSRAAQQYHPARRGATAPDPVAGAPSQRGECLPRARSQGGERLRGTRAEQPVEFVGQILEFLRQLLADFSHVQPQLNETLLTG